MSDSNFSDYLNELADADGGVEEVVSESIKNLKGKIKDIEIKAPEPKVKEEPKVEKPKVDTSLADRAIETYKTKVIDAPTKPEEIAPKSIPSTIASRENIKAITRSLAGMRSSGNSGKNSPVPPGGAGNESSATGGNYYANTSSLSLESVEGPAEETLEEYQARIFESFGLSEASPSVMAAGREFYKRQKEEGSMDYESPRTKARKKAEAKSKAVKEETTQDGPEPTRKQRKGAMDNIKQNLNALHNKEDAGEKLTRAEKDKLALQNARAKAWGMKEDTTVDLIGILEDALLVAGAFDWQSVDAVTRQVCAENAILPKELNREFKAQHGVYPDKWILTQEEVEECGVYPLTEAQLMHKMGIVYDVSFLFRGGRQTFKFFWPTAHRPSQEEMQKAVELFYPRARLLAYYPSRDQGNNSMVVVPPMTENYSMVSADDWVVLSDADAMILEEISDEMGEPLCAPILQEDGTYEVLIANHDTGEEEVIEFGEAAAWTRKEGQNSEGGLNEKGRRSYERANPGSDLKRPQPEGGKRRDSFCARSDGQRKMHNIDCSKDPDKRICKARRKWKC